MIITTICDLVADALYVPFVPKGTAIVDTRQVRPGFMLGLDETGRLVGIEVLSMYPRINLSVSTEAA